MRLPRSAGVTVRHNKFVDPSFLAIRSVAGAVMMWLMTSIDVLPFVRRARKSGSCWDTLLMWRCYTSISLALANTLAGFNGVLKTRKAWRTAQVQ